MNALVDDPLLDEEARRIHGIVDEHLRRAKQADRLPPQVRCSFDVEFGEDSEGDPVVQVWLHVRDGRLSPHEDVSGLAKLTLAIQRELSTSGLPHWTNVSVRPRP